MLHDINILLHAQISTHIFKDTTFCVLILLLDSLFQEVDPQFQVKIFLLQVISMLRQRPVADRHGAYSLAALLPLPFSNL